MVELWSRPVRNLLNNLRHESLDTFVVLTLLLMDVGWVLGVPLLGLAMLFMGLNLQGIVLYLCWQDFTFFGRKRDANALLIPEIALTLWLLSNVSWICSEYLWEESEPMGILNTEALATLPEENYSTSLVIASAILWFAVVVLLVYYCVALGSSPDAKTALLDTYYPYLWWLPWMLNEACWATSDLNELQEVDGFRWEISVGFTSGVCASFLCFDCTRRLWCVDRRKAALIFAEFWWVVGNLTWWIGSELDSSLTEVLSTCFFLVGAVIVLASLASDDVESTTVRTAPPPEMVGQPKLDASTVQVASNGEAHPATLHGFPLHSSPSSTEETTHGGI